MFINYETLLMTINSDIVTLNTMFSDSYIISNCFAFKQEYTEHPHPKKPDSSH